MQGWALINVQRKVLKFCFSKQDADTIFQEAASLNMTGHGYAWIVTEQVRVSQTFRGTRDTWCCRLCTRPTSPMVLSDSTWQAQTTRRLISTTPCKIVNFYHLFNASFSAATSLPAPSRPCTRGRRTWRRPRATATGQSLHRQFDGLE